MNRNRMIRAVPGRLVLDPNTNIPIDDTSVTVPATAFWLRRVRDGDVESAAPVTTKAKSTKNDS